MKSYILAARPKTLPAAIVPVWLGCVLSWKLTGVVDVWLAVCTVMGAIWIQIATNFFNDAIDSDKGADTKKRLGPKRATASGLLSRKVVYSSAAVCLLIATFFGANLFFARGWPIVAIGIPSLYLCYGYTGGPVPLAYRGLGELFVILFFGVVAVTGTVFVQTGEWFTEALLLGGQVGLLSAVLISINNLRDREEDAGNDKRTLAVKWGAKAAMWVIFLELALPYVLGTLWKQFGHNQLFLIPCLAAFLAMKVWRGVSQNKPSVLYNKYLALSALHLILFGALFTVAAIW